MSLSLPLRSAGSGATAEMELCNSVVVNLVNPVNPILPHACGVAANAPPQPHRNMKSLKIKTTLVRYL